MEEYSESDIAGTRNIISFDESAPPSDMMQCLLAETREAHAEHWRETADLVENYEQPVSLRNVIANHIWNNMDLVATLNRFPATLACFCKRLVVY
jgi:hypothetical protein